jgi:hypothetical protein
MSLNQKISIDPAVLRRCGSDLSRVAEGLGDASARVAGASISSGAFGTMNSWMVGPITSVSDKSTTLIAASGKVTAAVGDAADASADDFDAMEDAIMAVIAGLETALGDR